MIPRSIPLEALRAFETAARHLSFTAAAAELGLTQGAVSQRIKALEAAVGAPLFRRLTRALALTAEGERLSESVRGGFGQIAAGLAAIGAAARPLRLTLPPSLAARWLMPRLGDLAALRPPLSVVVLAEDRLLEIGVDADVGLRFGPGRYTGLRSAVVGGDSVFPVCSPGFLAARPEIAAVTGWAGLPRLVDSVAEVDAGGCRWRDWAEAAAVRLPDGPAITVSQAHLALQAAVDGLGIALARQVLAADDLAAGRLVRLARATAPVPVRYRYAVVTRGEPDARARALTAWIRTRLAATVAAAA